MSKGHGSDDEAAVQRILERVRGVTYCFRLGEGTTRHVFEKVVADMPSRTDDERLIEARFRLVVASE